MMPLPHLTFLPPAPRSHREAPRPSPVTAATALAPDLFTRPYADLDDVEARIAAALDFLDIAVVGRPVPADLSFVMVCARETLATLHTFRSAKARAREFRAEHGIETMKDLWFAFADHAALLGLRIEAKL